MTSKNVIDDIDYIKSLAEGGVKAPLVGGRIGLIWGLLLSCGFFYQWAIISNVISANIAVTLIILWLGLMIIGSIGSYILGQKITRKPGSHSIGNQVDAHVWTMFTPFIISLSIGAVLYINFNPGRDGFIWSLAPVIGFAGQGFAYNISAKFSRSKVYFAAALLNYMASILCFCFFGKTQLYLIAAMGMVICVVLPSLITIRSEPKDVV